MDLELAKDHNFSSKEVFAWSVRDISKYGWNANWLSSIFGSPLAHLRVVSLPQTSKKSDHRHVRHDIDFISFP